MKNKIFKIIVIPTDGTNDTLEGVNEFVTRANKQLYHFAWFDSDELCEINEDYRMGMNNDNDLFVVYSKEKFTRSEAKKYLVEINKSY